MIKKIAISFFIVFSFCLPARAENWILVAETETGKKHYLDLDSISGDNGYYYYWKMIVRPYFTKSGLVSLGYESMACREGLVRLRKLINYDARGNIMTNANYSEKGSANTIKPESVNEAYWEVICK